jgi:hypothetical protein
MTFMKSRLAERPFGRVLLHVACVLRDHHWRWHWLGIQRELTRLLAAAFLILVLLADHAYGAAPASLVNVGHIDNGGQAFGHRHGTHRHRAGFQDQGITALRNHESILCRSGEPVADPNTNQPSFHRSDGNRPN